MTITLDIKPEIWDELERLADQRGVALGTFIAEILDDATIHRVTRSMELEKDRPRLIVRNLPA